jgi:hypothetical protein
LQDKRDLQEVLKMIAFGRNGEIHQYPFPISGAVTKYMRIPSERVVDRHSVLCDLFESLVKLLAIVAVRELPPQFVKQRFPSGLDFLKHPSLGHWVQIIRELCSNIEDDSQVWTSRISRWYLDEKAPKELRDSYQDLPELNMAKGVSPVAAVIDSLVTYRNKVWKGHGAVILGQENLERRIGALEFLLTFLIERASFLADMQIFYVKEVRKIDDAKFAASGVSLRGIDLLATEHHYSQFDPREVYLATVPSGELQSRPIKLTPLVDWQQDEKGEGQFYFLNDVKRSKIEYLSHVDGSFYYHREVRKEIANIFSVAIQPVSKFDDEKFYRYTEEQRQTESEHFFTKGRELASKGNWEGAIIAFEDALEWHRDPAVVVAMCEAMVKLGDDYDYILTTLESAFEMDPDFQPAVELQVLLRQGAPEKPESELRIGGEGRARHATYFDAILPDRLRDYSGLLVILALLLFDFAVFFALWIKGPAVSRSILISPLFHFLQVAAPILALIMGSRRLLDSYYLLLRQIQNIKEENFRRFFDESFARIFGHFECRESGTQSSGADARRRRWREMWRFSLRPVMAREKWFLVVSGFGTVAFTTGVSLTQDVPLDLPPDVMVFRVAQGLWYWWVMALTIRFIFGLSIFIREFSGKELVPIVSARSRLNGFRALSNIFLESLILLSVFWFANCSITTIFAVDPLFSDVLVILLGYVIVLIWTIWIPVAIQRALRYSKSMAITDYGHHVKKAFEGFVANPDDRTLERLDWLVENDTRVGRISSRLFVWSDWIKLALTHLFLAAVTVVFVAIRFGYVTIPWLSR